MVTLKNHIDGVLSDYLVVAFDFPQIAQTHADTCLLKSATDG